MRFSLLRTFFLAVLMHVTACGRAPEVPASVDLDYQNQSTQARVAIVFIHGIMGSAGTTFKADGAPMGWPEMLSRDESIGVPVYVTSLAYSSDPLSRASNIHEIATRLQTRLSDKGIFQRYDRVVFITHSMGGLIAKRMLLQLNRDSPEAYSKVSGIFFMATPAGGAELADLAAWISKNPQFRDMASEDLNTFLQAEEDDWNAMLRKRTADAPFPKAFCIYEKQSIGPVVIVPRSRSQTGCDERPIAYDRNHINLVKPTSSSDEVYEYVLARVQKIARNDYVPLKVSLSLISSDSRPVGIGAALKSGEQYAIQISATKPAWFYVFAEDSSGKVERYYPSDQTGHQEQPLTAIRVPSNPANVFTLDRSTGLEQITVIASKDKNASWETRLMAVRGDASQAISSESLSVELEKRGATVGLRRKTLAPAMHQRLDVSSFGAEAAAALTFRHE